MKGCYCPVQCSVAGTLQPMFPNKRPQTAKRWVTITVQCLEALFGLKDLSVKERRARLTKLQKLFPASCEAPRIWTYIGGSLVESQIINDLPVVPHIYKASLSMLIVTISSQRVFCHKGQRELSGLESIKQLRLNSSQLGNTITINVTKRCPL